MAKNLALENVKHPCTMRVSQPGKGWQEPVEVKCIIDFTGVTEEQLLSLAMSSIKILAQAPARAKGETYMAKFASKHTWVISAMDPKAEPIDPEAQWAAQMAQMKAMIEANPEKEAEIRALIG